MWSLRGQRSVRTLRWLCVSVLLNARSSSLFCVLATQRAGTVASRGEPAACARSKMGGITQLHQGNHSYTGNMCAAARVTNQTGAHTFVHARTATGRGLRSRMLLRAGLGMLRR